MPPDGAWNDERVIVFTEYRDTQLWLAELLRAARARAAIGWGCCTAGWTPDEREHLKAAFQADPTAHPVRILLATDAASEGIDLQRHCHRVIHYDIPFNPNRLEQRIGRVDRYGQTTEVDVVHFVGAGWQSAPRRLLRGGPGVPQPRGATRSRPSARTSAASTRCWPAPSRHGCSAARFSSTR